MAWWAGFEGWISGFDYNGNEAFHGWEQKINDNGVLYYVKNENQLTSWSHPYLDKVFQTIDFSFSDVKYAAYRTALKLRTLQTQLGLHWINIESLKETLPPVEDESGDLFMTYKQGLEFIEKTLGFSQDEEVSVEIIPLAADLILNLLAKLYDRGHSGKLVPRCLQNALIALCGSKLGDKYKFLCARLPKLNGDILREHITCLIDDLMQIPYILKEGLAFGIDVAAAVDSCLNHAQCNEISSVSSDSVFSWLCCEPQTLVWLPTLHRMIATEKGN
ncbi:hypothetical protein EGW08_014588 [Elysia chlorotica]|uniref:WW domain-containing protein n=1 Tax=Elysia chlorotica TaxID=188477 RepID=A0A3S1B1L0_ELYCH|nr:hypothetical protein EGW08_014588 [Elysia chlorotica]